MSPYKFGQLLRASRLGFHWCEPLGCFVRIAGGPPWHVHLAEPDALPKQSPKDGTGEHRCWWEVEGGAATLLKMSSALRALVGTRVTGCRMLVLDDQGELTSP